MPRTTSLDHSADAPAAPSSAQAGLPVDAPAVSQPPLPATYELAQQELEALIARIESGQLPLDQLLSGYQRGAQLLAFCRSRLEAVEQQIKVLDQGQARPWNGAEAEGAQP